ncbi:MAG: glycosyltransferase, partial [Anaerolineae bacterium]|nr:glycosyltransferase [Anaerolineae bacterium]
MQTSVIVPVWNGSADIEACLKAVYEHSGGELLEVICLDNASEDDSVERIRKHFPQVRLLQQPINLGFAGGVNVGVDAARGDLLVL